MVQLLIISYVILSGIVNHQLVSASPCRNPDKKPCFCSTNEGDVSLQALMNSRQNHKPFEVGHDLYTFYIAPCDNPITAPACKNLDTSLVGCQVDKQNNAFGLGAKNNYAVTGDPQEGTVTFINQYKGIMRLQLNCSPENGKLNFINQTASALPVITYSFRLDTHYACLNPHSGGLSTGSVLVIIFFVAIIVYLVGGTLFLKYVRKAEGRESIPNYEFWSDFPSLVKDGVLFTFRGCKAESTYEKI
ncbi:hypothetical protein RRG08_024368 [Elysia crispata]|uniref:Cation-dependent mannose-6-phosphate receptor n=1 Tax=Elysia crispata TaxID=231223 RepID=A0AAE0ZKS2_9GAST|nr:hypothetical protein RRG08_024368 [Elysia crispata]